jgi:nicotinamidase-related amidase
MASIDKFNEHCWKDVIPEADLELYAGWRRETFVGARPALLAIDLYDLVYRGGPHSPNELNARYPNSCGVFAHRAIAPTKRLLAAARRAGIPIFYCTQETRPQNRPKGAVSTRQRIAVPPDGYAIYHEFTPQPEDVIITNNVPASSRVHRCPRISRCSAFKVSSSAAKAPPAVYAQVRWTATPLDSMSRWSRNAPSTAPSSPIRSIFSISITNTSTSCISTRSLRISTPCA